MYLLDSDSLGDDAIDPLDGNLILDVSVEEAGKVSMESLVSRDELIRVSQSRHEPSLLQPEDSCE